MKKWLEDHAWTLLIAAVTLVSTWTAYGYRIEQLERQHTALEARVGTLEATTGDIRVTLGEMKTSIEYIRRAVDKLSQ